MVEITSIEGFKRYRSLNGYFIITDTIGTKLHVTRCKTLDVSKFKEKVMDNEKRNGGYFYTDDLLEALAYPKVKK